MSDLAILYLQQAETALRNSAEAFLRNGQQLEAIQAWSAMTGVHYQLTQAGQQGKIPARVDYYSFQQN